MLMVTQLKQVVQILLSSYVTLQVAVAVAVAVAAAAAAAAVWISDEEFHQ
jgi:hypothetical protein